MFLQKKPKVFSITADNIVGFAGFHLRYPDYLTMPMQFFKLCKDNNMLNPLDDLNKLKTILFNTPEAEHAKLELIKEEIATGQYQINHHNIAEKLLEFASVPEELEIA